MNVFLAWLAIISHEITDITNFVFLLSIRASAFSNLLDYLLYFLCLSLYLFILRRISSRNMPKYSWQTLTFGFCLVYYIIRKQKLQDLYCDVPLICMCTYLSGLIAILFPSTDKRLVSVWSPTVTRSLKRCPAIHGDHMESSNAAIPRSSDWLEYRPGFDMIEWWNRTQTGFQIIAAMTQSQHLENSLKSKGSSNVQLRECVVTFDPFTMLKRGHSNELLSSNLSCYNYYLLMLLLLFSVLYISM